jgi:hypothetical protein
MHLKVTDANGKMTIMCLDRESGTATLLRAWPEHLERAVAMAEAEKAPCLRIIVDPANQPLLNELEDEGWTKTNLIVYQRNRHNDGKNKPRSVR